MMVYMKDGLRAKIQDDLIVSFSDGYVSFKQFGKDNKSYYTRLMVPKESLILIDFENDGDDGIVNRGKVEIIGMWD